MFNFFSHFVETLPSDGVVSTVMLPRFDPRGFTLPPLRVVNVTKSPHLSRYDVIMTRRNDGHQLSKKTFLGFFFYSEQDISTAAQS